MGSNRALAAVQVYEPFFADFGPLNMGCVYRFCQTLLASIKVRQTASLSLGPRAGTARLLRRLSPHASPFAFPCDGTYGAARSEPSPTVPGAAPFRPRRAPGPGARSLHAAAVQEASAQGKRVYFLTNGADPHLKANASVLVSTRAARGSRAWLAGRVSSSFVFFL